jgi:hypothetical protein
MNKQTARAARVHKLLADLAATYAAAPIVETLGEYRDVFDRAHSRASVELTHGTWSTFTRMFSSQTDSGWKQHADRESARAYAREWLAR